MPPDYDVITIGAGVSGVTAAALLSNAGLRVGVYEAQPRPGGYLSGFQRRGFIFDTSIVWLNQCGPGGSVYRLMRHLGEDFPRCHPLRDIRRYKGESFDYLLTSDPTALRGQLLRDFPNEAAGVGRFFDDARTLGRRWQMLGTRTRSIKTMSLLEKGISGAKMLHWVLPVWKHLNVSAEEGLRLYFKGDALHKVFCTEEKFISIILPIGWAYAGDFQRAPDGGGQALIEWLIRCAETSGARYMLGKRVERLLVDGRRATGVVLAGGERVRSRFVVAACDVESLYERIVPSGLVPRELKRKLREADLYNSHVTVFLGLDCDPGTLGFGEESVCLTRDDISRVEQTGGDPHKTALIVSAPSVRDRSLAPAGRGTLTIQCTARIEYEDHWRSEAGRVRGAAYQELKEEFARVLVKRVDQSLAPGLREHIVLMEVATPLTYERYTSNRAGSIMGATPSKRNIRNKIAHYRTPVENLLLAGHWAEYGGGLPVAMKAAANSSLMILRELNPRGFADLKAALDGR